MKKLLLLTGEMKHRCDYKLVLGGARQVQCQCRRLPSPEGGWAQQDKEKELSPAMTRPHQIAHLKGKKYYLG